jgi:hypothetical protein
MEQAKITLQCVREKNKLRIKFYSYTNEEGKVFTNVYNNSYNCRFPRNIREEGAFYEVGPNDIDLNNNGRVSPFYTIRTHNIKVIPSPANAVTSSSSVTDVSQIHVYAEPECVCCMCEPSCVIFIPCAHQCTCEDCYKSLVKFKRPCPICRRDIRSTLKASNVPAVADEDA